MNCMRSHLSVDSTATKSNGLRLQSTVRTSTALNQPNSICKGHCKTNILRDHRTNSRNIRAKVYRRENKGSGMAVSDKKAAHIGGFIYLRDG